MNAPFNVIGPDGTPAAVTRMKLHKASPRELIGVAKLFWEKRRREASLANLGKFVKREPRIGKQRTHDRSIICEMRIGVHLVSLHATKGWRCSRVVADPPKQQQPQITESAA